jgi:hypothetical protein
MGFWTSFISRHFLSRFPHPTTLMSLPKVGVLVGSLADGELIPLKVFQSLYLLNDNFVLNKSFSFFN